jgi:hypothetical protein
MHNTRFRMRLRPQLVICEGGEGCLIGVVDGVPATVHPVAAFGLQE